MAQRTTNWQVRITLLLAVLIPSGYGFVGKFIGCPRLSRRAGRGVCGRTDDELPAGKPGLLLFAAVGRRPRHVSRY
jgi:hypothetical protein